MPLMPLTVPMMRCQSQLEPGLHGPPGNFNLNLNQTTPAWAISFSAAAAPSPR